MTKTTESHNEHSVSIKDRSEMTLSGVNEVVSFSESAVVLKTSRGDLLIKGTNLKIGRLNTQTGELYIGGCVNFLRYGKEKSKGGLFEGLLR